MGLSVRNLFSGFFNGQSGSVAAEPQGKNEVAIWWDHNANGVRYDVLRNGEKTKEALEELAEFIYTNLKDGFAIARSTVGCVKIGFPKENANIVWASYYSPEEKVEIVTQAIKAWTAGKDYELSVNDNFSKNSVTDMPLASMVG